MSCVLYVLSVSEYLSLLKSMSETVALNSTVSECSILISFASVVSPQDVFVRFVRFVRFVGWCVDDDGEPWGDSAFGWLTEDGVGDSSPKVPDGITRVALFSFEHGKRRGEHEAFMVIPTSRVGYDWFSNAV